MLFTKLFCKNQPMIKCYHFTALKHHSDNRITLYNVKVITCCSSNVVALYSGKVVMWYRVSTVALYRANVVALYQAKVRLHVRRPPTHIRSSGPIPPGASWKKAASWKQAGKTALSYNNVVAT